VDKRFVSVDKAGKNKQAVTCDLFFVLFVIQLKVNFSRYIKLDEGGMTELHVGFS
jgi:hypothetical protein